MSVNFPKLDGLDSLARRDGVDIRPTLVRVLTDLYVQKASHTSEEERHYTELALRLIDSVDLVTRAAVAKKLGPYAGAPPAVARRLARDVIQVAEPVLQHSRALSMADLDAVVRDFGSTHAAAIASREATALERSVPAIMQQPAPHVAQIRPEQATELSLAELFFSAESAERRMLLMSLGSVEAEKPQSVQPVETIRALETAALARNRAEFTTLLQNALGLAHEQAERIVADPSGEPLLVAGKALAMPSVTFQRILMFIDPAIGESVQRFFDLAGCYERVSADAAHKVIASIRGREPVQQARRPAAHRPMFYDDEAARGRRGFGVRRPAAAAEPQVPAHTETGVRQRTI